MDGEKTAFAADTMYFRAQVHKRVVHNVPEVGHYSTPSTCQHSIHGAPTKTEPAVQLDQTTCTCLDAKRQSPLQALPTRRASWCNWRETV